MNKENFKTNEEISKEEVLKETTTLEEVTEEKENPQTEQTLEGEILEEATNSEENIEEKKDDVEILKGEVEKLNNELEEMKQAYIRKQADYQNFTKRKEKEVEELKKYASEKIIGKLLDGIDNLTRAIDMANQSKDIDGLIKGVELTLNQFSNVLKAEGLEEIETLGKEYNPEEHQGVMVEASEEHENDFIIAELQKGYKLRGRVIRPAMVKVCKK